MFRGIILGLALTLGGCATPPPTVDEQQNAYYGEQPDYQWAKAEARELVKDYLKDAESARYEWLDLERGYIQHHGADGSGIEYGYVLNAKINAKNSFGAYAGFRNYRFLFRDGELVTAYGERRSLDGIVQVRLK